MAVNPPLPMTILNVFLDVVSYFITLDCFIYLGMFAVLCGLVGLIWKLAASGA